MIRSNLERNSVQFWKDCWNSRTYVLSFASFNITCFVIVVGPSLLLYSSYGLIGSARPLGDLLCPGFIFDITSIRTRIDWSRRVYSFLNIQIIWAWNKMSWTMGGHNWERNNVPKRRVDESPYLIPGYDYLKQLWSRHVGFFIKLFGWTHFVRSPDGSSIPNEQVSVFNIWKSSNLNFLWSLLVVSEKDKKKSPVRSLQR